LATSVVEAAVERLVVATLRADDPVAPALLPPLHCPVMLGVFTLAIRLRGFERVERGSGTYGVVQEWHCELP
jgi:hypothetical protein